jgi:hypothetical protein
MVKALACNGALVSQTDTLVCFLKLDCEKKTQRNDLKIGASPSNVLHKPRAPNSFLQSFIRGI